MDTKRVLIIEDEVDVSNILQNVLKLAQIESDIASSGKEALQKLQQTTFHGIILDLTLPDTHGKDLYHQIVAHHPELKGKVLFTSGYNLDEELERLLEESGNRFMQKPFQLMELKAVIAEIVNG